MVPEKNFRPARFYRRLLLEGGGCKARTMAEASELRRMLKYAETRRAERA
jgi:hypothetical protein